MEVEPDELRKAVEYQHGGTATLVQSVLIYEEHAGQTVWDGTVHVFDLAGHPKATRAYAWSSPIAGSTKRQFFAVLHIPPIDSPVNAVRAAIVAEAKGGIGLSKKALHKLRRKAENEASAKEARFWKKPESALQLGYSKPVNRQAAKDLNHKPPKKR